MDVIVAFLVCMVEYLFGFFFCILQYLTGNIYLKDLRTKIISYLSINSE